MPDWEEGITIGPFDPSDSIDIEFDFGPFVGGAAPQSIIATVEGMTLDDTVVSDRTVTAWVSGGTPGISGILTFKFTGVDNKPVVERSINILFGEL